MAFGLAGALPYLGTSAFTIYLANQAGEAASGATSKIDPGLAMSLLDQAMNVQVTYGAVMLGFLGALHWGMEFAQYGGTKGSKRLMLGMAPVLVGWGTLALDPSMALVTQWAGFTGLWYADMKATSAGWSTYFCFLSFSRMLTHCSTTMVLPISLLSFAPCRHLHYWHACWHILHGSYAIAFCRSS